PRWLATEPGSPRPVPLSAEATPLRASQAVSASAASPLASSTGIETPFLFMVHLRKRACRPSLLGTAMRRMGEPAHATQHGTFRAGDQRPVAGALIQTRRPDPWR